MNILNIAYYTGIKYFRNVIAMCFFIVAPFLFLYMMGIMVNNTATDTSRKEKVGYCSFDTGEISTQFEQLLHSDKISELIDVTLFPTPEEGIAKIKSCDIDAFVYIGQDFSKKVKANEKADIRLYQVKNTSVAKTLVNSFVNSINGTSAVVQLGGMPTAPKASDNMTVIKVEVNGKAASNKDMASISCLLIFIFYGALLGSNSVLNDLKKKTYIRLTCAPIRYMENFFGQLAGNTSVMFIFTMIGALAAHFVFGVNLSGNIFIELLVVILFLIVVNSLGILLARLTKNIYLCGLFTFALNYLMLYPVTANMFAPGEGTVFDITRFISPHFYTYQAIMGSIYKNTTDVQGSIAILALMALILCSASWLVERRANK